jgi:hypothetical protein
MPSVSSFVMEKVFSMFSSRVCDERRSEKLLRDYSAEMLRMIDDTVDENGYEALDNLGEYPDAVDLTKLCLEISFDESSRFEEVFD